MGIVIIRIHKSVSKNFFLDENNLPLPTEQILNQEQQNQCSRALCCWCLEQRFAPENSCSYMYVIKPKNKMITNRCMCLQLILQDLTINSTQNVTCYSYRSTKTNLDRRALHSVLMQSFLVQFPGKLLREVRGLNMFNGICSQQFPIELCLSNQLVLRSLWKLSACIKLRTINKWTII